MSDKTSDKTKVKSPARWPRWAKILLVVSLALNLLIIGAAATRYYFVAYGHDESTMGNLARAGAMHRAGMALMWRLPRERRNQLRQFAMSRRMGMQQNFTAIANARLKLAEIIEKRPFDQAAFDKAFAVVKKAEAAAHDAGLKLTRDFIARLSDDERAIYVQMLKSGKGHSMANMPRMEKMMRNGMGTAKQP